jgi:hypothetical protein
MMTEALPIAIVTDHNGMVDAFRARKEALNLSDAALEARANLTAGHVGKLLGAVPAKHMGILSQWAIAWALGLKVVLIEDADAMALHAENADQRRRPDYGAKRLAQVGQRTITRMVPVIAREIGSARRGWRGGKAGGSSGAPGQARRDKITVAATFPIQYWLDPPWPDAAPASSPCVSAYPRTDQRHEFASWRHRPALSADIRARQHQATPSLADGLPQR